MICMHYGGFLGRFNKDNKFALSIWSLRHATTGGRSEDLKNSRADHDENEEAQHYRAYRIGIPLLDGALRHRSPLEHILLEFRTLPVSQPPRGRHFGNKLSLLTNPKFFPSPFFKRNLQKIIPRFLIHVSIDRNPLLPPRVQRPPSSSLPSTVRLSTTRKLAMAIVQDGGETLGLPSPRRSRTVRCSQVLLTTLGWTLGEVCPF